MSRTSLEDWLGEGKMLKPHNILHKGALTNVCGYMGFCILSVVFQSSDVHVVLCHMMHEKQSKKKTALQGRIKPFVINENLQ